MKKVSLLGLFLLASTTQFASAEVAVVEGPVGAAPAGVVPAPGCPKAFQGFHLGGNIGYGVGIGRHRHHLDDNADSFRFKHGVNGVDGGVGVGYTHRVGCNWALGIAFDANWTNVKGSHTFPGENIALKTRLRNTLQLYGRLGYVLRDIAMPFIGLGWDNSQWRTSAREIDSGLNIGHKSKRVNSFMWKLGVDFLATKHVVVGFEYTGNSGGKVSHHGRDSFDEARNRLRVQYNKFALTAKIVY